MLIRKGTEEDVEGIFRLIQVLAEYEHALEEVETSPEQLKNDGFGKSPLFQTLVAEEDGEIIGFALYFFTYSTWKGKCLYLEDFAVTEEKRKLGVGQRIFNSLKEIAKKEGVKRFSWQVLDWNEPAIAFYKKNQAELDDEWINCRIRM